MKFIYRVAIGIKLCILPVVKYISYVIISKYNIENIINNIAISL